MSHCPLFRCVYVQSCHATQWEVLEREWWWPFIILFWSALPPKEFRAPHLILSCPFLFHNSPVRQARPCTFARVQVRTYQGWQFWEVKGGSIIIVRILNSSIRPDGASMLYWEGVLIFWWLTVTPGMTSWHLIIWVLYYTALSDLWGKNSCWIPPPVYKIWSTLLLSPIVTKLCKSPPGLW